MAQQDDLISSLTKGFPKGVKINKTINLSLEVVENFHNLLRKMVEEQGYQYYDIINELKILDNNKTTSTTVKVSLNRNTVLLSSESEDPKDAKEMSTTIEKLINDMK